MAHMIRLPEHCPDDDPITCEMKRRTWWSLYMIDRWSSAGLSLPRQIQDNSLIPLPIFESDFHRMNPDHMSTNVVSGRPGLWAHMITLARIFGEIQDLVFRFASGELNVQQLESPIRQLADELESFADELPSYTRLSITNLEQHSTEGLGQAFVALHLGYHHYATLLYFQYLDLQLERTPVHRLFAARCKKHAASFSDLLQLSKKVKDCEAVYFIVGHMTVVSSGALLHTLFFGDDTELPDTRQRLEANFETLTELRRYWPAIGMMVRESHVLRIEFTKSALNIFQINRLFTFQSACMQSANPNTHKIDRWMVKFLLQHASPIEDRSALDDSNRLSERGRYANDALSILRAQG